MLSVEVFMVALVIIWFTHMIYKWRNPKCNGILPPGSMGWPLIGETLQLLKPSPSIDVHPFIKNRMEKYGPIFRTSLAGRKVVVSTDAETNHHFLVQEGKLVELWQFDIFSKMFKLDGDEMTNAAGVFHKYLRCLLLSRFGAEKIKENLIPVIEGTIDKYLNNWTSHGMIDFKQAISTLFLHFTAKQVFSYDPEISVTDDFSRKFECLIKGYISFPLNVPGSLYNKCMKNQKKICDILRETLKKKRASPELHKKGSDLLDQVIKDVSTEKYLNEDTIIHLLYGVLFASHETLPPTLTLTLIYLADQPEILEALAAEHETILKNRSPENKNSTVTWEEYKSMTFTLAVINESLRLASHALGTLRRALKDIPVKGGYTIPAGWTIMLGYSANMLCPEVYKDPLAFNPWRFKELESSVLSKNFIPFGGGSRQCAGAELTRAFMTIFLHVLVTKYKWNKINGGDVVRTPFVEFGKPLHINISKK